MRKRLVVLSTHFSDANIYNWNDISINKKNIGKKGFSWFYRICGTISWAKFRQCSPFYHFGKLKCNFREEHLQHHHVLDIVCEFIYGCERLIQYYSLIHLFGVFCKPKTKYWIRYLLINLEYHCCFIDINIKWSCANHR